MNKLRIDVIVTLLAHVQPTEVQILYSHLIIVFLPFANPPPFPTPPRPTRKGLALALACAAAEG